MGHGTRSGRSVAGQSWGRVLVGPALALALVCACDGLRQAPPLDYDFAHGLLNDHGRPGEWRFPQGQAPTTAKRPDEAEPTPAPPSTPPAVIATVGTGSGSSEALEAARLLLGMREAFDGRSFVHHILQVADTDIGVAGKPPLDEVYRALKARALTFNDKQPKPGDLVFFHNTDDANRDGRPNDWYTLGGVVEGVAPDGTVTVIVPDAGEICRRVMNPAKPDVYRDGASGPVVNDILRPKRLDDAPATQYLAGTLFAGFATLP